MRVAATVEQCWHDIPGGTAFAALHTLERVARAPGVELVGVAAWHRHDAPDSFRPPMPVRQHHLPRPLLYEAWQAFGRPRVERVTGRVDIVHATSIIIPGHAAPLVVTIHDLAWRHDGSSFSRRGIRFFERGLELARRDATVILCSSLATLRDCEAAGIPAARLRHVPLGVTPQPVDPDDAAEIRRRRRLGDRFVLFVGTIEPRKNLGGLLEAMRQLPGLPLVVAGTRGWGEDLTRAVARLGEQVRLLGFVRGDELAALYAAASVCCYPSFWEGFGLPIAEAMAQGTPVVTSRGGATEEVAGGAAVLVDPADPTDIARGINEALDRHDELAAAGRHRAATLTWDATADATLRAYQEVTGLEVAG